MPTNAWKVALLGSAIVIGVVVALWWRERSYIRELGGELDGFSYERVVEVYGEPNADRNLDGINGVSEMYMGPRRRFALKFGAGSKMAIRELIWHGAIGVTRYVWLAGSASQWVAFDGIEFRGVAF